MRQEQLVEHIKAALGSGVWRRQDIDLPGAVHVIYTEDVDTPEWAKRAGRYAPSWQSPTYQRIVAITLIRGTKSPKLRVSHAPWMSACDSFIRNTRAAQILDDPTLMWRT